MYYLLVDSLKAECGIRMTHVLFDQSKQILGNFHITAGKSVHHALGHAHLTGMVPMGGRDG